MDVRHFLCCIDFHTSDDNMLEEMSRRSFAYIRPFAYY